MGYHIAMKMRYTLTQYNNKIILNKKEARYRRVSLVINGFPDSVLSLQ